MKWGVFFIKSEPFLNAGCIMYSISIFYFTFYLFGGCVRTQRTPPPAYGPEVRYDTIRDALLTSAQKLT